MTNCKFDRECERFDAGAQLMDAPTKTRKRMIEEYQRRSKAAFAPATLRNYKQIKALFTAWRKAHGHNEAPPVSPQIVAEYVDYLGG